MALDRRLEIRLDEGLLRDLAVMAAARQWPMALCVRELLRQALADQLAGRGWRRQPVERDVTAER